MGSKQVKAGMPTSSAYLREGILKHELEAAVLSSKQINSCALQLNTCPLDGIPRHESKAGFLPSKQPEAGLPRLTMHPSPLCKKAADQSGHFGLRNSSALRYAACAAQNSTRKVDISPKASSTDMRLHFERE